MSSDWWSRKLSGNSSPAPPRSVPPTTPPIRIGQQVQYPDTHHAPQTHDKRLLDPSRAPTDEIRMGDAIRLWKGGEAMRKEGGMRCPECDSQNVFSRRSANTSIQGKPPAPRCFECGWTGLYTQGDESSWAV
jgi:DNA-directed RNA polymerase subunit RPC12/RpoP